MPLAARSIRPGCAQRRASSGITQAVWGVPGAANLVPAGLPAGPEGGWVRTVYPSHPGLSGGDFWMTEIEMEEEHLQGKETQAGQDSKIMRVVEHITFDFR